MIRKHHIGILFVITSIAIAAFSFLFIENARQKKQGLGPKEYFSVSEVWANAQDLIGRTITVEGPASFEWWMTAVLCCPPDCDCNETYGFVFLISESDIRYNTKGKFRDDIGIETECGGNECEMTCTPFDPHYADRLEITGTLAANERDGRITGLSLINVDYSVSRQFVNGQWQDIQTGTFVIPLATVTPEPNACNSLP